METRANFVLIGAFTLAVIAGAFLFVLWLSGLGQVSHKTAYKVIFTGSVSGLARGGSVLFNGLRVGEVTQLDFVPNDPGRVAAWISVEGRIPVKKDTKARLELQGLTGAAAIALTGGAPNAPDIVGKDGEPAVIEAEPSQIQNLLESVQSISAKADVVLGKADKLINENGPAITDTLRNIDNFSKALGDSAGGINGAISGIGEIGRKIGPLAQRLETLTADADKLLVAVDPEKVKKSVEDLNAFTASLGDKKGALQSAFNDAASLAKRLNETSKSIDSALADVDSLVKSVDAKKIADVLDGAQALSSTLRENKGQIDHALKNAAELTDKLVAAVDAAKIKQGISDISALAATLADGKGPFQSTLTNASALAQRLNESSNHLDTALVDVDTLIKSVDAKKIARLVDGADALGSTLTENKGNIDRAIKNASELTAKLNDSADKVDGLMTTLQSFIGSPDVKGPLAQVGDAAKSIRVLADQLNVRVGQISVGLTRFSGPGLREFEALAIDARRAINDVDRVVKNFERDPTQLIWGPKAKPTGPK